MLFLHITDSRFVLLWILNIPAFFCGTHFDQSWWDPGTQKEISWQNKSSRNVSKLFQQLKNISSFKICDQSGCMTMWEGLKVLLALTWDILHSCWGIHLLWVMVNILNHAGRNLVWCQCGYSSPDCAPLCVCVPAPVLGACHSKGGFPQAPCVWLFCQCHSELFSWLTLTSQAAGTQDCLGRACRQSCVPQPGLGSLFN